MLMIVLTEAMEHRLAAVRRPVEFTSERDLHSKLHDSRTGREKRSAEGTESLVLWYETGRRGNATLGWRTRDRILNVVHECDIRMVQDVERFPDDLQFRSFSDVDVTGEPGIQ